MTLVPKDSPLKTNSESDSLVSVMPMALQEPLIMYFQPAASMGGLLRLHPSNTRIDQTH